MLKIVRKYQNSVEHLTNNSGFFQIQKQIQLEDSSRNAHWREIGTMYGMRQNVQSKIGAHQAHGRTYRRLYENIFMRFL